MAIKMNRALGVWVLFFIFGSPTFAGDLSAEIVGRWLYDGFIFEGRRYAKPNPELMLYFTFDGDGSQSLYWSRKDEQGFCERRGIYQVFNTSLWQKVTWVNPKNGFSCGGDPDMQVGRETENRILIQDNELGIFMELNGRELIYLLKKVASTTEIKSPSTF